MTLTDTQKNRLDAAGSHLNEALDAGMLDHASFAGILRFFKDSEAHLLALLDPKAPPPPESGHLEFGAVLYQLESYVQTSHPLLWKALSFPMKELGIHADFDPKSFSALWTTGKFGGDGTMTAFTDVARFAMLDPGWLGALVEYLQLELGLKGRYEPFPDNPAVCRVPKDATVTLAMTGDWGTGHWGNGLWGHEDHGKTAPALKVIDQIEKKCPDFTIHLGDVYYGGTFAEEKERFLQLWYAGPQGTFTLNSNHEMYDGARGYFIKALSPDGPFKCQNQTSYFAIESDDWVIVGLDSAYFDKSRLFMQGALVDPAQTGFLGGYRDKATVIVLTHHNPFDTAGTALVENPDQGGLWNNVVDALGRAPDFWYWGHLHNGIVYKEVPGNPNPAKTKGIQTKGRCLGHGAIPFGKASDIVKDPDNVAYYAHTPMPDPVLPYQKLRVLNGWVRLTLGGGKLTEEFFEAGGDDDDAVWSSSNDLACGSGG